MVRWLHSGFPDLCANRPSFTADDGAARLRSRAAPSAGVAEKGNPAEKVGRPAEYPGNVTE